MLTKKQARKLLDKEQAKFEKPEHQHEVDVIRERCRELRRQLRNAQQREYHRKRGAA